jgi:hypothetical protein
MGLKRFIEFVSGSRIDPDSKSIPRLFEKGDEPYNCLPSGRFTAYKVKRSRKSGEFVTVRNRYRSGARTQ